MLRVILVLAAIAHLACSQRPPFTTVSYGVSTPTRDSQAPVEVFNATLPDKPIQEVGEITTTATHRGHAMHFILAGARQLGADGVILTGPAGEAHARSIFPGKATKTKAYGMRAIAFVYKRDRPAP